MAFEKPIPYHSIDYEASSTQYHSNTSFSTMGSKFSMFVRIKPESIGSAMTIFSMDNDITAAAGRGFTVRITTAGLVQVRYWRISGLSNGFSEFISTTTLSAGSEYDILVLVDATNGTSSNRIQMYINGSAETASSSSLTANSAVNYSGINTPTIGARPNGTDPFDGELYMFAMSTNTNHFATTDVRTSSGEPKDIRLVGLTKIHSYFDILDGDDTHDFKIGASTWAATNSPTIIFTTLDGII